MVLISSNINKLVNLVNGLRAWLLLDNFYLITYRADLAVLDPIPIKGNLLYVNYILKALMVYVDNHGMSVLEEVIKLIKAFFNSEKFLFIN